MAVVIGAATVVIFQGACAVSANWGYNPNTQRSYCIGEWTPRDDLTVQRPTETLNLTVYSGDTSTYDCSPTTGCEDANTITASLTPAACGDTFDALTGDWFVTSYSFSKDDATAPGQESWSMMKYATGAGITSPTYVLRGTSEGQTTDENLSGVTFAGGQTLIESQTGNVSAGAFGKAYTMENGVVTSVGNSQIGAGETGQGSASMPYTPMYLG